MDSDIYPGCHVKRRVLHKELMDMCPAASKGGQAGSFEEQCTYEDVQVPNSGFMVVIQQMRSLDPSLCSPLPL